MAIIKKINNIEKMQKPLYNNKRLLLCQKIHKIRAEMGNIMNILVRKHNYGDIDSMVAIWNEVVKEGNAFPQEEMLDQSTGAAFFNSQSYCGVAWDNSDGNIAGLYILHPNNIGRCGHICNASYAVAGSRRGQHIGEMLVKDCIKQAKAEGFRVLQFNAVVASNIHARHLYERLGFKQLGTITGGFRMDNGVYEDICPYFIVL